MAKRLLWLATDVVLGLVLAGVVAPLVLVFVPPHLRGGAALASVCIVSIGIAGLLRRFAIGHAGR